MADRPTGSTSRVGRPRPRSRSVHLPSCIPIAPKTVRTRAKSVQKTQVKGKSEEDMEAHLLRTDDWMTTHDFPDNPKVRRFCLTLSGEARLWYETLNVPQQQLN